RGGRDEGKLCERENKKSGFVRHEVLCPCSSCADPAPSQWHRRRDDRVNRAVDGPSQPNCCRTGKVSRNQYEMRVNWPVRNSTPVTTSRPPMTFSTVPRCLRKLS